MGVRKWINRAKRRFAPRKQTEIGQGRDYFRFSKPEVNIYPKIAHVMGSLSIVALDESDYLRTADTVRLIGSLNEVLECLRDILDDDYGEFVRDGIAWKGGFEYVVRAEEPTPFRLEILTRLYGYNSDDTFHYGREIQRIEVDRFAIWVDD